MFPDILTEFHILCILTLGKVIRSEHFQIDFTTFNRLSLGLNFTTVSVSFVPEKSVYLTPAVISVGTKLCYSQCVLCSRKSVYLTPAIVSVGTKLCYSQCVLCSRKSVYLTPAIVSVGTKLYYCQCVPCSRKSVYLTLFQAFCLDSSGIRTNFL